MAKEEAASIDLTEGGLSVDFSQIADLGPIPGGVYDASVVSAKPGVAQSGYPKIDLAWKVEEGEFEGRQIFDTLAFHPNALPMTKRKLLNLGFPEDFSGEIDPEDLLGASATLTVTIQKSENIDPETSEPYPDRNRVNKISGGTVDITSLL